MLNRYIDILIVAAVMVALYVAQNRGILTDVQVQAILAAVAAGGIPIARRMKPPEKPDDSDPPIPKHRMPVAVVLTFFVAGCSGTFDDRAALGAHDRKLGAPQGSAERCADLSDAQDNWTLVGKVGAGVGLSGALAPAHEAVRDDPTGRWVSLGVASGGALLAGVGVHMAGVKGGRYVEEGCGQ